MTETKRLTTIDETGHFTGMALRADANPARSSGDGVEIRFPFTILTVKAANDGQRRASGFQAATIEAGATRQPMRRHVQV